MEAQITTLDRITIPNDASEYYVQVQSKIIPFLDSVMRGAHEFDECSTRIKNHVQGIPNEELCKQEDKESSTHGTREIATIQAISLAIGTLAGKSVLADNPSALRIYAAILELADAIRDVQLTGETMEVIR